MEGRMHIQSELRNAAVDKECVEANMLADAANTIDELQAQLAKAQPVLDAAKEYAHWHTYEYSEIDDKDLAYDNLLEAVKAREEAKCAD